MSKASLYVPKNTKDSSLISIIDSRISTFGVWDRDSVETLTNKTLTSPKISTISNTGTLTLPTNTGTIALTFQIPTNSTYVDLTSNQTVTGVKTINDTVNFNSLVNIGSASTFKFFSPSAAATVNYNGLSNVTIALPLTTGTLALVAETVDLTTTQSVGGAKTFSTSLKVGTNGTALTTIETGTFSLTFSSVPTDGNVNRSVSFANTFSSAPKIQLTNQSASTYSGCSVAVSNVSTTGFDCYGTNHGGTVTAIITVAYFAYN
jgi:hypothetical protein